MPATSRFTDRMVRRHPALMAIAIEYARTYDGEFEPMVQAHEAYKRTGALDLSQARLVLNCLRSDLDLEVQSLQIEADSIMKEERDARATEWRRGLHVVSDPEPDEKVPERPWRLEMPLRVKVPYGMPRGRSGHIHRVDWAVCIGTRLDHWQKSKVHPDLREGRNWKVDGHWKCGKETSNPIFLTEDQAHEIGSERSWCRTGCFDNN